MANTNNSRSQNSQNSQLLPIATLFRIATGQYSFGLLGYDNITEFEIPSPIGILKTCKVFKLLNTYFSTSIDQENNK